MTDDLMCAEMRDQPDVLRRLWERRTETVAAVRAVVPGDLRGVLLLARGSSDNAAVHARYLVELTTRRPTALAAPSLWTRYDAATSLEGWVVVAISQSGRTPEIVDAVGRMRAAGARTVAVTNAAHSDLAKAGDVSVALQAGEERAVPATKTVTASMLALCHVAAGLGGALPWEAEDERLLPDQVAHVLDREGELGDALDIAERHETVHLGRGYTLAVALESALKFKETTLRAARGYATGDFLHGPVAAVGSGSSVFGYAAGGPVAGDVLELLAAMRQRDLPTVLVADDDSTVGADASAVVSVPGGLPEPLMAILMTVRAQQLARGAALRAGLDPDRPRGLSKVTITT